MSMQTVRVLNYAINGLGVGHVTRLRSISRWLRRLSEENNCRMEILFITSSEADVLLFQDGFPVFKIPSRTIIKEATRSPEHFEQAARECVWAILEAMRPDLLIVDTAPAGSFGEFLPFPGMDAFELCRHKAFIYRPMKSSAALKGNFQKTLERYDLILVPEYSGNSTIHVPDPVVTRVDWCGPIVSLDRSELLDRESALRSLGIKESGFQVYISTGGGGHEESERRLHDVCAALADVRDAQLLVAAGPLYRGSRVSLPNLAWLDTRGMASHLAAVDIAVSAAGYNSFNELMFAGIPTVFLPLDTPADDQWERARRAETTGAGLVLSEPFGKPLREVIDLWRDGGRRIAASRAARQLVPENCARVAADRLFRLLTSHPSDCADQLD